MLFLSVCNLIFFNGAALSECQKLFLQCSVFFEDIGQILVKTFARTFKVLARSKGNPSLSTETNCHQIKQRARKNPILPPFKQA